jgi:hypothetical protein
MCVLLFLVLYCTALAVVTLGCIFVCWQSIAPLCVLYGNDVVVGIGMHSESGGGAVRGVCEQRGAFECD